jgi:hypothetical protein
MPERQPCRLFIQDLSEHAKRDGYKRHLIVSALVSSRVQPTFTKQARPADHPNSLVAHSQLQPEVGANPSRPTGRPKVA